MKESEDCVQFFTNDAGGQVEMLDRVLMVLVKHYKQSFIKYYK